MKTTKNSLHQALFALAFVLMSLPSFAQASETAAWVPWFGPGAGAEGAKSAIKNIDKLDVVYLFTYEVQADGTIVNRANYNAKHWKDLIETAQENDVKVIPTVAWFDGEQIHNVLSNRSDRRKQVNDIIQIVEDGDFDGINIDYEGKKKETNKTFPEVKTVNKSQQLSTGFGISCILKILCM